MSEFKPIVPNLSMKEFHKTDNILMDMQSIIETTRKNAYSAINTILIQRNWLIG